MFRFLLSRRWLGLGLFVVFMVVASWFLGNWQLDRWDTRKANNARAEAHMNAAPVGLDAICEPDGTIGAASEWTRVKLTGTFRTDADVVVRFMNRNSSPGVDVVTPFDTEDGETVLINRGWMAAANNGARPDDIPPPRTGTVTLEGWWHPNAHSGGNVSTPIDGTVRAINSASWKSTLGTKAVPGYIAMQKPQDEGLLPQEPPELGNGPHFFYAIQWFFFGLLAIFGGFWFVRAELKEQQAAQASVTRSK